MKKFDLFLVIIAFALVSFGFYFSKMFKPEIEFEVSKKTFEHKEKINLKRRPSQIQNQLLEKNNQKNAVKSISSESAIDTEFAKKYVFLKSCIHTQDCNFSQEDPRAYELEVYVAINVHLKNIDAVSAKFKDRVLKSAARLADGYIKETVLSEVAKNKLASKEWRDLMLNEYIGSHNARLIPETIKYLKTYTDESDKVIIHQKIFSEIATGSPKVANALAENLKILLDDNTVSFYKSQISNLEEGPIKNNLSREILDYEMLASAG